MDIKAIVSFPVLKNSSARNIYSNTRVTRTYCTQPTNTFISFHSKQSGRYGRECLLQPDHDDVTYTANISTSRTYYNSRNTERPSPESLFGTILWAEDIKADGGKVSRAVDTDPESWSAAFPTSLRNRRDDPATLPRNGYRWKNAIPNVRDRVKRFFDRSGERTKNTKNKTKQLGAVVVVFS